MSHFPTGSYVLLDNLVKDNRFVINAMLTCSHNDVVDTNETFWFRYLYIYTPSAEICLDLWELDLLDIEPEMDKVLEWGNPKITHSFDDAMSKTLLTLNGTTSTWKEHLPKLEKNKKLRDVVFTTNVVKILDKVDINKTISLEYRLVYDANAPMSDEKWDRSEHQQLRYRIKCNINLSEGLGIYILFDKGRRGFPSIKPVNWYPTREMDGVLISKEKALSVDAINYIKPL